LVDPFACTQILFAELFRAQCPQAEKLYDKAMRIKQCTLRQAMNRLPSTKWRLGDAFKYLTGRRMLNAHEALADTIMLVYVYFKLNPQVYARVRIPEPPFIRLVAQDMHQARVSAASEASPGAAGGGLTEAQRRQIEANRLRALAIRRAREQEAKQQQQQQQQQKQHRH